MSPSRLLFVVSSSGLLSPHILKKPDLDLSLSLLKSRSRYVFFFLPLPLILQARVKVPESTLQKIRTLNWLDVEPYKYAQGIASKQHDLFKHKLVRQDNILISSYGAPTWEIPLMALAFALFAVLLFLYLKFGRRSLKVKI